jgi:hypothetical protein
VSDRGRPDMHLNAMQMLVGQACSSEQVASCKTGERQSKEKRENNG